MDLHRNALPTSATRILLPSALPFLILLAVWWVATAFGGIPEVFLPSPLSVLESLATGFADGSLLRDMAVSAARVFGGFLVSFLLAVPLGVAAGLSNTTRSYIEPLNDFIRYIPVPAMVPLIILWFGLGNISQVAVIVFGTLPQLIVLIADAISRMPQYVRELCQSLQLRRLETLWHAVLPYSGPQVYDGSRVAIGWAWSYLLVAEVVGATHGLGQAIVVAQRFLQTPRVVAAILLVALIGLTVDFVMRKLYPIFFPWVSEVRQAS